jgi:stringent starvation protein B
LSQNPAKPKTPTSKKPYILRALYEWIVDNGLTPMIVVDANAKQLMVPPQAVKDDRVVLNISPISVFGLNIGNDLVQLRASFSGVQQALTLPIRGILALYPREGVEHGLVFGSETDEDAADAQVEEQSSSSPRMRVVAPQEPAEASSAESTAGNTAGDNPPTKAKPTLRVVK